jgi:hypothetical protein
LKKTKRKPNQRRSSDWAFVVSRRILLSSVKKLYTSTPKVLDGLLISWGKKIRLAEEEVKINLSAYTRLLYARKRKNDVLFEKTLKIIVGGLS